MPFLQYYWLPPETVYKPVTPKCLRCNIVCNSSRCYRCGKKV